MLLSPALVSAATPSVSVKMGSSTIPVGGYTYLTITVEGSTRADVDLPSVSGLILRDSGTSQNTSIINGHVTKSAIIRVTVLGDEEGSYTIPSFPVIVENQSFPTQPVSITVTNAASSRASSGNNSDGKTEQSSEGLTAEDIRKISRIEIIADPKPVYVGQKVPIKVQLWVNTVHRFDNLSAPVINDEHILMEALGQNYERTIQYDGNDRFEVYEWDSSFTALKEGDVTLESETEVTVLVRAKRQTSAFDSIFDSDFFSPSYRRIPLLIKSNKVPVELKSLPSEQPAGFTGAIGRFTLKTTASPTQLNMGDPITLDIEVSGEGNFDRVFFEGLPESKGFKTYAPEIQFEANPQNPMKGTKSFKQAVIARNAEIEEIPSVNFVYFDTDTATFKTLSSPPIPIQLTQDKQQNTRSSEDPQRSPSSGLEVIKSDGWIPIQLELDAPVRSLQPVIFKPIYWLLLTATPTSIVLLSFLIPFLITRGRKTNQQRMNELRRALRQHEKDLTKAVSAGQSKDFVQAATQYSRQLLGFKWTISPHSITSADAKQRLGNNFPRIRELLQLNDSMHYAGGIIAQLDIEPFKEALESEWKALLESLTQ